MNAAESLSRDFTQVVAENLKAPRTALRVIGQR
jgi:hypothetical protein